MKTRLSSYVANLGLNNMTTVNTQAMKRAKLLMEDLDVLHKRFDHLRRQAELLLQAVQARQQQKSQH